MIFLRVLFFFFFLMIRRPTRSTSTNTLFPYNDALPIFVLDWAKQHGIGFSHFISLGDSADVDFGDMLDYLASDPQTRAILLYIESVKHARKFISAARGAARNKPIVAVTPATNARAAPAAAPPTTTRPGGGAHN